MEIDKYEALLEKAKDFDNLRNGGIWRIVEELVEAVEDLLEENSFLDAGKDSDRGFALGWKAAIKAAVDEISCGGCYGSCGDPSNCRMDDAASIHSTPVPADAAAALDRLTVQAKAEGMREAAKLCSAIVQSTIPGSAQEAVIFHLGFTEGRKNYERAILARAEEIEKELSNE